MPKKKKPLAPRKKISAAHWKKSKTISAEKYDSVSKAILKILGTRGMRWGDLADQIKKALHDFEGSVPWYTISCLRELETQGKVNRDLGPPVLYSKKKSR